MQPDPTGAVSPQVQNPTVDTSVHTPSEPADSALAPSPAEGQSVSPQEWVDIRDAAKNYGVDLSTYPDANSAFQALIQSHQGFSQLQQQYHQLARERNERQLSPNQTPSPTPGGINQAQSWWSPPLSREEAQRLAQQWYTQDPNSGEVKPRPDAPLSVIEKVEGFKNYVKDWEEKLRYNPEEALGKMVEERAKKIVQEQFQSHQVQQSADQIIQKNLPWMVYWNNNQPVIGHLTPDGLRYKQLVEEFERHGIKDVMILDRMAQTQLQGERAIAAQQAAQRQAQMQQPYPQNQFVQPPQGRLVPQHQPNYAPPQGQQGVPQGSGSFQSLLRGSLLAAGLHGEFDE